jgi:hypothetical protein
MDINLYNYDNLIKIIGNSWEKILYKGYDNHIRFDADVTYYSNLYDADRHNELVFRCF